MADILRLERRAQAPILDFSTGTFTKIRAIQREVFEFVPKIQRFFTKPGQAVSAVSAAVDSVVPPVPPPPQPPQNALNRPPLNPVQLSGFYKVTGPTEATFYSVTDWPIEPIGPGWIVDSLPGLRGQIYMTATSNKPGKDEEEYTWSFTIQTDMDQFLDGTQYVTVATLYPPGRMSVRRMGPIYGYYEVVKRIPTFYFTAPPSPETAAGWIIEGLPTLGPSRLLDFSKDIQQRMVDYVGVERIILQTVAVLDPVDGSIPENAEPVYVKGFPAIIHEPDPKAEYVPGRFLKPVVAEGTIQLNPNIKTGNAAPIRDLNTGVGFFLEPKEQYLESKGRGFSQGSVLGLFAIGPQEKYLFTDDFTKSQWNPAFKQHSNFVMYQRVIPIGPPHPFYQGQSVQVELKPTELGHLLSNMYLKLTIPALPAGAQYTPEGGRAFIKQVDLLVNETTIETIYDDWYITRDQVFLDADEQAAMQVALRTPATGGEVVIPLEFFFCRRHSYANKGRDRLRRPYFPLCAMWNQRLYVKITFHPSTWWSNATTTVDFSDPKIITEEILLENSEKLYYQNTPLKYIVNRVQREAGLTFTQNNPQLQLTANFPVQTLAWFFRKAQYEDPSDSRFSDSRYNYGYTTKYIAGAINLAFPSGTTKYVDVIETAKITLNNIDILSTFQGSLYYSFKQPMEHGLAIPSKNIYTYSFGLTPKEYNQGGYLNFAKLNSQTTTLSLTFGPSYATEVSQGYNLYMFYYGYTLLQFQGGFASLPYL